MSFQQILEENRIGVFHIGQDLLRDDADLAHQIQSRCLIVNAEVRWDTVSVKYMAYSEEFEPADKFCHAPEYDVLLSKSTDDEGKVTVSFDGFKKTSN